MRAIWPGALLVCYLAATGILLIAEWERVPPGGVALHFVLLAAIATATWVRLVPRWLQAWAPLIALLFLYTEMPMLIRAVGHQQLYDTTVIGWESALLGGQPALDWASRWPSRALSELLHLSYLSYYPIIFSVPAALLLTSRRAEFNEAVFILMLTFVVCFLWYVAFPVAGPRYLLSNSRTGTGGPIRSAVLWLLETRSSRGTAFPSSHVAVAVAQSILAIRYFGARGSFVAVLSAGIGIGAVYGGFHYAVDVIAGAILGATTAGVGIGVVRWLGRRSAPQANATAPT